MSWDGMSEGRPEKMFEYRNATSSTYTSVFCHGCSPSERNYHKNVFVTFFV